MKYLLMIILGPLSGQPSADVDPQAWVQPPIPTHSISPIVYDTDDDCHAAGRQAVAHLMQHKVGGIPIFRCIPQGS